MYVCLFKYALDNIVLHHLNTKIDNGTQDLHSMTTNDVTHLVTQCTRVTPQSVHNKALKLRPGAYKLRKGAKER